jgi:dTMP kinase
MFITFEGPEGSGKTSQIPILKSYLQQMEYTVFSTREPGGTSIGDQIRKVLLTNKNTAMHPRTEILLFQASRVQLVEQEILPRLARGEIVLCDRYADSTLAYQGYGHQVDLKVLGAIVGNVEVGLQRRQKDGDINRLDAFTLDFHRRVRAGYHQLAQAEPDRWVIIDAEQPYEAVQQQMQSAILARLGTA